MFKTIIGTKKGMTQLFDSTGNLVPVTVISAGPCTVTNVMTKERNGYSAVQLGYGDIKEKALNKSLAGMFKKNNTPARRYLKEFRVKDVSTFQIGQEIKVDVFKPGDFVDVSGISIGKGFAGAVKRHGFRGGPATHGQSDKQRSVGSIGDQGHQHVTKGHRMPGRLGYEMVTIQKLKVVEVIPEHNAILVNGAVPGARDVILVIKNTTKTIKVQAAKPQAADKKKSAKQHAAAKAPAKK